MFQLECGLCVVCRITTEREIILNKIMTQRKDALQANWLRQGGRG